jgi:uncharacterized membrane protein (UPF0127 family)
MEKEFEFYIKEKKIKLRVKICKSILSKFLGLMFKIKSKSLLFIFNKEKKLSIHSFFCQPFVAIWISSNGKATKIAKISKWMANFSGHGRFLLEIPKSDENYYLMTKMINLSDGKNRKV